MVSNLLPPLCQADTPAVRRQHQGRVSRVGVQRQVHLGGGRTNTPGIGPLFPMISQCQGSAASNALPPTSPPQPPAVLSSPPFLEARLRFLGVPPLSPLLIQNTGQVFPLALALLASPHPQYLPGLGKKSWLVAPDGLPAACSISAPILPLGPIFPQNPISGL